MMSKYSKDQLKRMAKIVLAEVGSDRYCQLFDHISIYTELPYSAIYSNILKLAND